ncbi:hypothetical protein [Lutimonas sp.]|uniref:hypothetical protein n=1 Tax=Lutimonas sp. TaxID=1872403 RepID=UPI003D9B38F2
MPSYSLQSPFSLKICYPRILVLLCLLFTSSFLQGQKVKKLFTSDSLLELTVTLPIKDVINDTKVRNEYECQLVYTSEDGQKHPHQVKIQVRGKTRALKQVCSFPPLQLNFNKKDTKNSIFKGQDKVKLVAHCKSDNIYQEYVQKEYVVYKMYEVISPYSFKVRLCSITYIDKNNPSKNNTYDGFLIESTEHVAKRNDMTEYKDSIRNQEVLNKDNLDKLVMFQYMIGNLDWSIAKRHNMKLIIGDQGQLPMAVPYDFDYAGMVDTPYAVPPAESSVSDVKTRVFRGFCKRNGYEETVSFYKEQKEELYDVINQSLFLTEKTRRNMIKYMDQFYKNMENPKYVDKKINKACRIDHKHAYDYE